MMIWWVVSNIVMDQWPAYFSGGWNHQEQTEQTYLEEKNLLGVFGGFSWDPFWNPGNLPVQRKAPRNAEFLRWKRRTGLQAAKATLVSDIDDPNSAGAEKIDHLEGLGAFWMIFHDRKADLSEWLRLTWLTSCCNIVCSNLCCFAFYG